MARWLTLKNLFSLLLVAWFAYGVWEARGYAYLAKIFPFYVSLVLLIFAVISIFIEIRTVVDQAEDLRQLERAEEEELATGLLDRVIFAPDTVVLLFLSRYSTLRANEAAARLTSPHR